MTDRLKLVIMAALTISAVLMLGYGGACGLDLSTNNDDSSGSSNVPLPALVTAPVPNSGANNVLVNAQLSWAAVGDATSYDVYFGTNNPPPLVTNAAGTTYNPGALSYSAAYYWRINSKNSAGATTGNLWSFSTEAAPLPSQVTASNPADGAIGVHTNQQLTWTPAGYATSYDIYFGITNPPPLLTTTVGANCNPETLLLNTVYYWRVDSKNATGTTTGAIWSFSTVAANGIAVDPYIQGLQFFEDLDNDDVKDALEQLSTLTDANGLFSFVNQLTLGSTIAVNPSVTGTHNGVVFTGKIKRTVDALTGTLVTSPLTTLLANGWTELEVINVLTQAGLTGITAADLTKDPMEGIELLDYTTLTDTHLIKIRASIAIYSFLSVMDGIINNGFAISYTAFTQNPNAIPLLQQMVSMINTGLSVQILVQIKQAMDIAAGYLALVGQPPPPPVTASDIIKASVAVSNFIIPKVIADINYLPNLTQCANLSQKLGLSFYLLRNKNNPTIQMGTTLHYLPSVGTFITFIVNAGGTDSQGQ
ncbi:MAG: hypothetical protein V1701_10115 [Planctomycetota bacterium]